MSWIRSSRGATLVVLFALALAAVGTAGAISLSADEVPNETRVGESVSVTITIEDPFVDTPDTWTLRGATELRSVSWTVTILQQGEQVSQNSYGNQEFTQALNASNGGDTIEVELTGTTPPVDNYTYDPAEAYTLYDFDRLQGSNEASINASSVHHYTNESKAARLAIDNASMAINESGGVPEAQDTLNSSISSYNNGNFGNAEDLASDARSQAEQAQQSAEQTQTLLYAGAAVLVLLVLGGGIYYWRSQQSQPTKLQ